MCPPWRMSNRRRVAGSEPADLSGSLDGPSHRPGPVRLLCCPLPTPALLRHLAPASELRSVALRVFMQLRTQDSGLRVAPMKFRLEFGGKLTPGPLPPQKRALMSGVGVLINSRGPGPLPPQKRALMSGVGALINSCGWPWLSDKHPLA